MKFTRNALTDWIIVLLALAALSFGMRLVRRHGPAAAPAAVKVDTTTGGAWRARADSLTNTLATVQGERDGLKGRMAALMARVAGTQARTLETRTVYDTIIRPDTVLLTVATSSGGALTLTGGIRADTGATPGYQPQVLAGASLADCDGGFLISGRTVVCHRPRFGHMAVLLRAGVGGPLTVPLPIPFGGTFTPALLAGFGSAGLRWTPGYRSGWAAELRATSAVRLEFSLERGVRLW